MKAQESLKVKLCRMNGSHVTNSTQGCTTVTAITRRSAPTSSIISQCLERVERGISQFLFQLFLNDYMLWIDATTTVLYEMSKMCY